jgi:hypothetical protein
MAGLAVPLATGIASYVGGKFGNHGGGGGSQTSTLNDALATARQARDQGGSLFNMGAPLLQAASGYWQKLLSGDKTAMLEATQPERTAINEEALGADRAIEAGPLRGGTRDYARAELNRTKFSKLGDLIPTARRAAAGEAASTGLSAAGAGAQATNSSGGLFSSLYGEQERAREFNTQRGDSLGSGLGTTLANLLAGLVKGSAGQAAGGSAGGRIGQIGGTIPGTSLPGASWAGIRF